MALLVCGALAWCNTVSADERAHAAWDVYDVHPWIEGYADELPERLVKKAESLKLSGPRNDWLTAALALNTTADATVRLNVVAPDGLQGKVESRVAGLVKASSDEHRLVYDPLISAKDIPGNCRQAVNFDQIKDFPLLHLRAKAAVMVWLTVDLRGAAAGVYEGRVEISDDAGTTKSVPIEIAVQPAELPVESPLFGMAWNWANSEAMHRDFVEHGINVAWTDHERAWNNGARFLLFRFPPSWNCEPIDDAKRAEVKAKLDEIWAIIDRLKVPPNQWAINLADEPHDTIAHVVRAYGALVKELRPETPVWMNPAWGEQADSNQRTATTNGTLKVIAPITDMWCPYYYHLWDGSGAMDFMRATKKPVWYYEIHAGASRRPAVGREALRKSPWNAWNYGLQGFGVFAANVWAVDPWVDSVGNSRNYSFTYPSSSGVMSSRGMEAVRQGVQEYKRLHVLRELGVSKQTLDGYAERALKARSVEQIDEVRKEIDAVLMSLATKHETDGNQ